MKTETPARIVAVARSWVGVPFVKYGRSRDGVDCLGLVICVLRECGCVEQEFCQEFDEYEIAPHRPLVAREVTKRCRALQARAPGALLLVREVENGWPAWFAIDTGRGAIVSVPKHGVVELPRALKSIESRLHSVWALPGVYYSDYAAAVHRRSA